MIAITSLADIPTDLGATAVTFGKFDGMHLGHQRLVAELLATARAESLTSVMLTFDRNPLEELDPARAPLRLTSNRQKRELAEALGIDVMIMLPFDREFRQLSPERFVELVLVDALHAAHVFTGPDPQFGADGAGHLDTLVRLGAELGFAVHDVAGASVGDDRVSSTSIRALLAQGDVAGAARLLGRAPSVRAVVVKGQQRGRELGYPTANLSPELEGFIPSDGVYAGILVVDGVRMPAAVSIGNNPTFVGVPDKQVEAWVVDADLDLYGAEVDLEFVEYVRGMLKFDGIEPLIERMAIDAERVREIFGLEAPAGSA